MSLMNAAGTHIHAESWGGTKTPATDGWVYSKCDTCGQRWRTKTVTEMLGAKDARGSNEVRPKGEHVES